MGVVFESQSKVSDDAVLSRNNTGLIGKMKDPETGNYVKGDYMTQLSALRK